MATAQDPAVTIRLATPDDAERMIAHVQRMAYEAPDTLPMLPGEFQMTVDDERELISKLAVSGNGCFMVAEVDGQIVGVLNCTGGKRAATRHAAVLGISIRKEWQGRGVGTAMLSNATDWAKQTGVLRRIELLVYFDNHRAIRLYEKHGFVVEGRHRRSVLRHGEFIDDLVMALVW